LSLIYLFQAIILISVSKKETENAEAFFFNRTPDLIVVFTGDAGRIPFALKKLKKHSETPLFITGVYSANSVRTIISHNASEELAAKIDSDRLRIDYQATNTVENVISTVHYLRKNHELNNIMVISHDYHIMRIRMIFDNIKVEKDNLKIKYVGLNSDYTSIRGVTILFKEVFKYIRTFFFLLLWA
jgi:uncharacterized SAM-binding protein YcdF (DUF218 family)